MLTISKFGTLSVAKLAIIILGELDTLTIMTSMMTPPAFAQPAQQQQQQSLQGMDQQQNETSTTTPSSSQTTTVPLSTDAATSGNNTRDSADGGGLVDVEVINRLTARAISYAEQANTALQSNDIEGASRNLNFALNELENIQGNLTSNTSGSSSVGGTNGDSNNTSPQATTSSSTPLSQTQQQEQPPSSPSPFSQQLQSQQHEQETGIQEQQSSQQSQNDGEASVSIVGDSASLITDGYSPNPVQVSVGTTVTWTNDDAQPHTVTSGQNATPDGRFTSEILAPAATFDFTFTEAGKYPYFCVLHPNRVGTVLVSSGG